MTRGGAQNKSMQTWKIHSKTPDLGNAIPVLVMKLKKGVVRILVIFQHRFMFSHINGKLSPRPFEWYG